MIFVANHASHLDTPLILLSLPDAWRRRTAVAAAADYFFDTWWRAVGSSIIFNTFPIDRRGGSMATTPGEVLEQGWSLVIFPEGTRSVDGWIGHFRMGAAYLSHEHGVPVVPVAHRGTFAAMPRGAGWPARAVGSSPCASASRSGRPRASRCATTRPGSRTPSPPCSTRTSTTWWESRRRAAAGDHARPLRARRSPSGAGSGSRPSRRPPPPPSPPRRLAPLASRRWSRWKPPLVEVRRRASEPRNQGPTAASRLTRFRGSRASAHSHLNQRRWLGRR